MAELLGAFVAFIVALIEAIVAAIGAILEAIGVGAVHLATKPEEGESRFSGRRLLVAVTPLVLVALLIGGTIGYFAWQDRVRRARNLATQQLVEANVDRLARHVDQDGNLVKHPAPTLDVEDAWGHPLHVAYDESLTSQRVVVRSAGDDETVGTWDDVSASRSLPRKKGEVAKDLLGKAKDAILDRIIDEDPPNQ